MFQNIWCIAPRFAFEDFALLSLLNILRVYCGNVYATIAMPFQSELNLGGISLHLLFGLTGRTGMRVSN